MRVKVEQMVEMLELYQEAVDELIKYLLDEYEADETITKKEIESLLNHIINQKYKIKEIDA